MRGAIPALAVALVVGVAGVNVATMTMAASILTELDSHDDIMTLVEETDGTVTAEWYSDGILIRVTLTQEDGEDDDEFAARFKRKVDAFRKKFPKDE